MALDIYNGGGGTSNEVVYLIGHEGDDWKKEKRDAKPWVCLMKEEGVECKRGSWKFRHYLANHMRSCHMMDLPKSKNIGRPPKPGAQKRKVNSKKMNLKVMGNPYKRARKELWKKEQAWKEEGEFHWKTLEEKAKVDFKIKIPPILATIIGHDVEALIGVKKLGEGILDGGKCETLYNFENLANLVVGSKHKRASKSMKDLFMEKDWKKNEDERKVLVKKLVDWHCEQAIRLPWKEGKDKWISRFMGLKVALYQMSNPTRMDHIEVACDEYRLKHIQGSDEDDSDSEGVGEDIECDNGGPKDEEEDSSNDSG